MADRHVTLQRWEEVLLHNTTEVAKLWQLLHSQKSTDTSQRLRNLKIEARILIPTLEAALIE